MDRTLSNSRDVVPPTGSGGIIPINQCPPDRAFTANEIRCILDRIADEFGVELHASCHLLEKAVSLIERLSKSEMYYYELIDRYMCEYCSFSSPYLSHDITKHDEDCAIRLALAWLREAKGENL